MWSAYGSFHIGFNDDEKAWAALSYQEANNEHVVQTAIRAVFKSGLDRLGDTCPATPESWCPQSVKTTRGDTLADPGHAIDGPLAAAH